MHLMSRVLNNCKLSRLAAMGIIRAGLPFGAQKSQLLTWPDEWTTSKCGVVKRGQLLHSVCTRRQIDKEAFSLRLVGHRVNNLLPTSRRVCTTNIYINSLRDFLLPFFTFAARTAKKSNGYFFVHFTIAQRVRKAATRTRAAVALTAEKSHLLLLPCVFKLVFSPSRGALTCFYSRAC